MVMKEGACRFGLWWVHVTWNNDTVYRVRFKPQGEDSPIPLPIRRYLRGKTADLTEIKTVATEEGAPFYQIYRAVQDVPYGSTCTYGDIASACGTSARVVGTAMKRNPTPLIVPCHRIVSSSGIGGFTPDVEIKKSLQKLEWGNITNR